MMRAWSVAQVRGVEAAAMASLPAGELMQRAARGLAQVLAARVLPVISGRGSATVVILAGAGGNGGDALYAGAFLPEALAAARASASEVDAVVVQAVLVHGAGDHGGIEAVRERGCELLLATGPDLEAARAAVARADVVVDGIVGIGARPGLASDPVAWPLVCAISDQAYVISVDLSSGTDPEGQIASADCVFADETVTFSMLKGAHLGAGSQATGLLTVADIGLSDPQDAVADQSPGADQANPGTDQGASAPVPVFERLTFDDVAQLWPIPAPYDDKYTRGVLGVLAGGQHYTGAAVLACTAAVEAGVGMVRYVGTPRPSALVRAAVPEAVHGLGRAQAWLIGPGLEPDPHAGVGDDHGAAVNQVDTARDLLASPVPCVLDAGGLDLLTGPRPAAGARTLLTPHAGELARLLRRLGGPQWANLTAHEVALDPVGCARAAATLLHATVLLKGHCSYIVAPTMALPVRVQTDAPAWLATAGAGDVLAGVAGALLAAGLDPLDAGSLAALVHGVAAHNANPGGPVRALRVAEALPATIAQLLTRQ